MIFINILKKNFRYLFFVFVFISVLAFQTGCNVSESNGSEMADLSKDINGEKVLKVNYIDAGQADSILIQSPNGANMLIDAGETKENAVLNYLNGCGIKKLDVVVATHPHEDHISEMSKVIENFDIGEFYMPKKQHTSKSFEKMIDALSAKKISPKEAKAGETINFDNDVKCSMVAPCKNDYDNLNNWSAVVKLTYGGTSFIFMGDAEALSEKEIIESGADIKADVLKVGHHGSHSSTSVEFIEKVSPKFAVISAAKENEYGHPHKETLETLNNFGVKIFGTYDSGNIIAVSDGENITFSVSGETIQSEDLSAEDEKNIGQDFSDGNEAADSQYTGQYIGNKKSKKYHKDTCSNLPSESNRVLFDSKDDAVREGYTPCSNCNP